jgi:hypothetical protein
MGHRLMISQPVPPGMIHPLRWHLLDLLRQIGWRREATDPPEAHPRIRSYRNPSSTPPVGSCACITSLVSVRFPLRPITPTTARTLHLCEHSREGVEKAKPVPAKQPRSIPQRWSLFRAPCATRSAAWRKSGRDSGESWLRTLHMSSPARISLPRAEQNAAPTFTARVQGRHHVAHRILMQASHCGSDRRNQ